MADVEEIKNCFIKKKLMINMYIQMYIHMYSKTLLNAVSVLRSSIGIPLNSTLAHILVVYVEKWNGHAPTKSGGLCSFFNALLLVCPE